MSAILKAAMSIALLAYVFSLVESGTFLHQIRELPMAAAVAAIGLMLIHYAFNLWRWWLVLSRAQPGVGVGQLWGPFYMSLFLNQVLPTGFGGDAARALYARRYGLGVGAVIVSTVVDRLLGLVSVATIASFALLMLPQADQYYGPSGWMAGLVLSGGIVGGLLLLSLPQSLLHRLFDSVPWRRQAVWLRAKDLFLVYANPRVLLSGATLLSLVGQLSLVSCYWALGDGMGLHFAFVDYLTLIPAVLLVQIIPLSVGGLGVRETALLVLLNRAGVPESQGVTLALLYLAVVWITTIPGGIWLAVDSFRKRGEMPRGP